MLIKVAAGVGQARVLLVGFDVTNETHIGRGENNGRTLLESNLVRSLTSIGVWSESPVELRQAQRTGESFAGLLQADNGRSIGAARLAS